VYCSHTSSSMPGACWRTSKTNLIKTTNISARNETRIQKCFTVKSNSHFLYAQKWVFTIFRYFI
jgi:hypothetical protein